MLVYRWPPQLTVVGAEWTVHDPVNTSYSLFTGAVSMTASQRRRRMVRAAGIKPRFVHVHITIGIKVALTEGRGGGRRKALRLLEQSGASP